ncbi:MAG TPA: YncE family protein [Candidatus Baltobacteraceae bacterium]|nr:YncE family protein [Candidatus Baltobacteraceae bacterium]
MPIVPFIPPQPVATSVGHGFDYVTVDAKRRRVYAAHGRNASLLIVNADTGKVLGQVHVGRMAGVAVNDATGNVYTGDGDDKAVSEVDPVAMKEVHRVSVDGPVDAIAYDASYHRIYADEDDGTRIFVIDTNTFKQVATIALPGHKPEYLAVDPQTHDVYQNIATDSEVAVIDPKTLTATRLIPTPNIRNNHPLQFDSNNRTLLVGGENGVLAAYALDGPQRATAALPGRTDQCSFEAQHSWLACASNGSIVLYEVQKGGAPVLLAQTSVNEHMHTLAIDPSTGRIWAVWGSPAGDFIQGFTLNP